MGEDAQLLDHAEREHRPQDLSRQARHEAERREIAEQHVLRHVHEEEVLLAERVDRRVERQDDEPDPRPEAELPPTGHGPAVACQRLRAPEVQQRDDHGRDDLKRLEGPGTE